MKYIITYLVFFAQAYGQETVTLNQLGKDFYADEKVSKDNSAKLFLVNESLMKELGLSIENLYELFPFKIDPHSPVTKKATFYSYAGLENTGDGRVIWVNEIEKKLPHNKTAYVDFTVKGIGATSLAADNDGLLSMKEAINSFIISEKNFISGFQDSARDLAIFKIDQLKDGKQAAISIRVGNQLRLSHLKYHHKNTNNFIKILDTSVRRALQLPRTQEVTANLRNQYIETFIKNLANHAALAFSRSFEHGMLHDSNVTSSGRYIDFGTSKYKAIASDLDSFRSPESLVIMFGLYTGIINFEDLKNATELNSYVANPKMQKVIEGISGNDYLNNSEITKVNFKLFDRKYKIDEIVTMYNNEFKKHLLLDLYFKMGIDPNDVALMDTENSELFELYKVVLNHIKNDSLDRVISLIPTALLANSDQKILEIRKFSSLMQTEVFDNFLAKCKLVASSFSKKEIAQFELRVKQRNIWNSGLEDQYTFSSKVGEQLYAASTSKRETEGLNVMTNSKELIKEIESNSIRFRSRDAMKCGDYLRKIEVGALRSF